MHLLAVGWCYLQLIGITHVLTVLMGAPLIADVLRTLLFSLYVVTIGFLPLILRLQGNLKDIYAFLFENELQLSVIGSMNTTHRFLMRNLAWGTIIGAWAGAIPIPLDWDRWWQRWPITCLVSVTIGAVVSLVASYSWLWLRKRPKFNKDTEWFTADRRRSAACEVKTPTVFGVLGSIVNWRVVLLIDLSLWYE